MTNEEWVQAVCNPPRPVTAAADLPPPPAYVYCRVSTKDQANSGAGIDAQKDCGKRWCEFRRLDFKAFFVDEAESGGTNLESRPAGQQLAITLEAGDHVVFPKLDRGWRNTVDMLTTVEAWVRKGITVHFPDLGLDTSSPAWMLLATVQSAFARAERDRIRERTSAALQALKRNGKRYSGSSQPLGFKLVYDPSRKRSNQGNPAQKIEYWPEEVEYMRQVVHWHDVDGMTWRQMSHYHVLKQIRTPRGIFPSYETLRRYYHTFYEYEGIRKAKEQQQCIG